MISIYIHFIHTYSFLLKNNKPETFSHNIITSTGLNLINCNTSIILHHPHCCYVYIPGTTYLHILLHSTLYLIAHLTPYFISLFVSYFILTIFIYIYSLVFCFIVFIAFMLFLFYFIFLFFLHFPLSGPVLTNISLLIIPCMIVYVTNNKEPWPWTLLLALPLYVCLFKINRFMYSQL